MTRAARSVLVFGVYLLGAAMLLVAAPNVLLQPLGIAPPTEPWIRVLGVVAGVLGAYYIVAARADLDPFIRATVWGRIVAFLGFCCLVFLGWAPKALIVFGAVDALGAFWTWVALRTQHTAA